MRITKENLKNCFERLIYVLSNNRGEIRFTDEDLEIPYEVAERFAKLFLPKIQSYFKKEENIKEFEKWQAEQNAIKKKPKSKSA